MLTSEALTVILQHIERLAIDRDLFKTAEQSAREDGARLRRDLDGMRSARDNALRAGEAARRDLAALREKRARFPLLIDGEHSLYIAFEDRSLNVATVKDDDGEYQDAGNQSDYAALIAAPLNPRCYLTCRAFNLLRLPAAPKGTLLVGDDIPF